MANNTPGSTTILIADDDRLAQQTLEALLMQQGYRVVFAADGVEALEKLREFHPDLCVLDVSMPRMNGVEVCRSIKNNDETKLLPVIMLTGLSPDSEKLRAMESGCDDFLTKPMQHMELLTRIRSLLRIKSLTDALEDTEVVLFTLARTIEAKDRYTLGHADRVARYAVAMGRALGYDADKVELLRKGGILHDIGKLGIPDAILQKEGPLDVTEWETMRRHTVIGVEICQRLKNMKDILGVIRSHHERLDGTGYPDGLKGNKISDITRVVGVVDIYDALTTRRSYKDAFPHDKAFRILREEAKKGWWDPDLVGLWEEMVKKEKVS